MTSLHHFHCTTQEPAWFMVGHSGISLPPDVTVTVNLGQLQQTCFGQSLPTYLTPFPQYLTGLLSPVLCPAPSCGVPMLGGRDSLHQQQLARQPPKHQQQQQYQQHTKMGCPQSCNPASTRPDLLLSPSTAVSLGASSAHWHNESLGSSTCFSPSTLVAEIFTRSYK